MPRLALSSLSSSRRSVALGFLCSLLLLVLFCGLSQPAHASLSDPNQLSLSVASSSAAPTTVAGAPAPDDRAWRKLAPGETVPKGSHVRLDMSGTGDRFVLIQESQVEELGQSTLEPDETPASRLLGILARVGEHDPALGQRVREIQDQGLAIDSMEFQKLVGDLWNERQAVLHGANAEGNATVPEPEPPRGAAKIEGLPTMVSVLRTHLDCSSNSNSTFELKGSADTCRAILESTDELLDKLIDLEDRVQETKQAAVFHALGGIDAVVELLRHEEGRVRSACAHVLGSAIKYTPDLQNATLVAFERVGLDALERLLEAPATRAKAAYALGSWLRGHPATQTRLASSFVPAWLLRASLEDRTTNNVSKKANDLLEDLASEEGALTRLVGREGVRTLCDRTVDRVPASLRDALAPLCS